MPISAKPLWFPKIQSLDQAFGEIEFSLHRPRSASTSTRERLPADDALDRLVQLFRKIGVEFTNLGCVGNVDTPSSRSRFAPRSPFLATWRS